MEPTVGAELLARLVAALLLSVLTGLAVALLAQLSLAGSDTANYVVPHQYDAESYGPVLTGEITDRRRSG